jgi:DNA (cytosine-5)-methyltransferase 1
VRFLSVCSGIEAASVAWRPLGWGAAAFSEIEPFPCSVLAHHYPTVPNWGDMTKFQEWPDVAIDLLCGGTPCQSFSVAGLRKGLDDPRGNLMLTFGAIAARYRPKWLVWENVPGVLSSNGGRDFGSFLGLLGVLGYGFAYRVLDAQYAGVPQRRRRVFVVGCLGDWRSAAAVLLERHGLSGHPAPSRQAGQGLAARTERGFAPSSFGGYSEGCGTLRKDGGDYGGGTETIIAQDVANTLQRHHGNPQLDQTLIPIDMRQASRGATMTNNRAEGSSGGAPGTGIGEAGDPAPTISTSHTPAVAYSFGAQMSVPQVDADLNQTLQAKNPMAVSTGAQVRRLTPEECEALQGFPRGYTAIPHRGKPAADGPRYKALGNSWAVPVVRWIGERIEQVESISQMMEAA